MQLRNAMKSKETEQAIFTDCANTIGGYLWGVIYGWPSTRYLGAEVSAWKARNSVGYLDLVYTGLFRDDRAVLSFLGYYKQYPFLTPQPVGKYGKDPAATSEWTGRGAFENADSATLAFMLDRKIKLACHRPPVPLCQELRHAIATVADRRDQVGRSESAQAARALLEPAASAGKDVEQDIPYVSAGPPLLLGADPQPVAPTAQLLGPAAAQKKARVSSEGQEASAALLSALRGFEAKMDRILGLEAKIDRILQEQRQPSRAGASTDAVADGNGGQTATASMVFVSSLDDISKPEAAPAEHSSSPFKPFWDGVFKI